MNKKMTMVLGVLLLCYQFTNALEFYNGSYQNALLKAKTENKPLLLYFTAIWCGPCRYMEKYIYPDPLLSQYVASNYVALKIDADTEEGKLLYIKAHQPNGPMGVPAFVIITKNEEVVKRRTGAMKIEQLKKFLELNLENTVQYKLLSDSLALKQIDSKKTKATAWRRFYFNAMVSNWKPSIKIGTNAMRYSGTPTEQSAVIGYEFGFFLDRMFKNSTKEMSFWHRSRYDFQPGISILSKGGYTNLNNSVEKVKIHYLELSALNSYRFKPLRYYKLFISPYISTRIGSSTEQRGSSELAINRFDYGAKVGLSRYMGNFEPYLGYSFGIKDIDNKSSIAAYNRGFFLSFAIIVGK